MRAIPLSLVATAIPGSKLSGRPDVLLNRLNAHSKTVQPGDLFACVRGKHYDGHLFVAEALHQGAAALMIDRPLQGVPSGTSVVKVNEVATALKFLAPQFYNYPALKMKLVGVTGTSGKTTITYMLRKIMESRARTKNTPGGVGLLGTIQNKIAGKIYPASNTTPVAWELQSWLALMVEAGCDVGIIEVSSHALAQDRVYGCEFDVAVFTNLSPEHLDFHHTLDEYAAAKRKLFTGLSSTGYKSGPKYAVVNLDDPRGAEMGRAARGAKIKTFALEQTADVNAREIQVHGNHTTFLLITSQGEVKIRLGIVGRYNVMNALAAAAAAECLGLGLSVIQKGLEAFPGVPGRLERLPGTQPFSVLVDYAHKPDALLQVLRTVREFTSKKLILVFGCGGERDTTKRLTMGEMAAKFADVVMVTSDNPRSEDPRKIIQEILLGCRRARATLENIFTLEHRGEAIQKAMQLAKAGDTVLLAGKGHENYQLIGDQSLPFNDRKVAQKYLSALHRQRKQRVRK